MIVIFPPKKSDQEPTLYLIPSNEWKNPNGLLVEHNYDKEGQKSPPELGINISSKQKKILEKYDANFMINELKNAPTDGGLEMG